MGDKKEDPEKSEESEMDDEDGDEQEDLGDKGKKALAAERKKARDADRRAKAVEKELKELKDKDKTETDRLRDENVELKQQLEASEARSLRLEVAADKGIKARYVTGSTREEMEESADEYLEDHPPAKGDTSEGSDSSKNLLNRKPTERLRGGGEPDDDPEPDVADIVKKVPRL